MIAYTIRDMYRNWQGVSAEGPGERAFKLLAINRDLLAVICIQTAKSENAPRIYVTGRLPCRDCECIPNMRKAKLVNSSGILHNS